MVRTMFAAALLLAWPCSASADITVFTSGGTNPGLRTLSAAWTAETGKQVNIVGGTVTRARDNVKNKVPGDLVLLPLPELTEVRANLKPVSGPPVSRSTTAPGVPVPPLSPRRRAFQKRRCSLSVTACSGAASGS